MVILKTNKDLFDAVHNLYGHSPEWIEGLARELQVTYNTARHLAKECGYYRHKLITTELSLDEFTEKPYAKYVIKKKQLDIV